VCGRRCVQLLTPLPSCSTFLHIFFNMNSDPFLQKNLILIFLCFHKIDQSDKISRDLKNIFGKEKNREFYPVVYLKFIEQFPNQLLEQASR
ncbi:hypothetical protein PSX43_23140, partial [Shigella flexneri]|nr:hypothetical protein [Shigella flexneri]